MYYLALSTRNLLTLLHKLVMADSERALIKPGLGGPTCGTCRKSYPLT